MKSKEQCFIESASVFYGIDYADVKRLWELECRLHRWHEGQSGTDTGCITRDEKTGHCYWRYAVSGLRERITDTYTLDVVRLAEISAKYPDLDFAIDPDPSGWAIHISRKG